MRKTINKITGWRDAIDRRCAAAWRHFPLKPALRLWS